MSLRNFTILVIIGFAAALGIAWFGSGVRAAECPYPLETVIATIESEGGAMLDLVDVADADGFDQMLLARFGKGAIVFGLVSKGCVITAPVQIGTAQKLTPA